MMKFIDLGDIILLPSKMIYIKSLSALAFSDLHIGLEFAFAESGVFIPPLQYKVIKREIKRSVKKFKPQRIIIVGDLKHTFSQKTLQEHKEVIDMLKALKNLDVDVILIRGNHDNFIRGILERYDVLNVPYLIEGEYLFIHGHKKIPEGLNIQKKRIVMGHMHPTITIFDYISRDKLPVFLVSPQYIILPALTPLLPGLDIITGVIEADDYLSPIVSEFSKFEAYLVIENKRVMHLGFVGEIASLYIEK